MNMSPLSLLPGAGPQSGINSVQMVEQLVKSLQPSGGSVVASQPVTVGTSGTGEGPTGNPFQVATGKGTTSRSAGPGGDVWAGILSALVPGPTGAQMPAAVLDPKGHSEVFTPLAQKTLAAGKKAAAK